MKPKVYLSIGVLVFAVLALALARAKNSYDLPEIVSPEPEWQYTTYLASAEALGGNNNRTEKIAEEIDKELEWFALNGWEPAGLMTNATGQIAIGGAVPSVGVFVFKRHRRFYLSEYASEIDAISQKLKGKETANDLNARAWYLATFPNRELRDGPQAVRDALKACKLTDYKDSQVLDTLAAAYAEVGNFDEAAKTQEKAIALAGQEQKKEFSDRKKAYKSEIPHRDW